MLGKFIGGLLLGYVCILVGVEMIPLITGIDIAALEAESEIVFVIMGVAQWLIPLSAVAGLIIWVAHSMTNAGRR